MQNKTDRPEADISESLRHFDKLPDSANVRLPVVAALDGCSVLTVRRHSDAGLLPPLIKIGPRMTGMNVGQLRRARAARAKTAA